ncbi:hypothetical protein ABB02_00054 [Clostridiaceae bacterium JG1575]|nr:hypothetical protein ABB02_00054 [Clostridiaceae bacterium JG1575]
MGLYKTTPPISARMAALWCVSGIQDAAVLEYGCMGHMAYGRTFLHRMGSNAAKLYSTHLGETDIAMGDTHRLTRAVQQVSQTEGISTIFLLPSSVPEVIGMDWDAIATELSLELPNTRVIPLPVGGFDKDRQQGVENTLLHLVKVLSKDPCPKEHRLFNIIGSCPDLYAFHPDAAELTRLVKGAFGATPLCILSSDTTVAQVEQMGGGAGESCHSARGGGGGKISKGAV